MEADKIITEAKAIPNREAAEEFAVRGAMIKCSFGTGFDVINLPLCHGVYSGENPLLNISNMVVGKTIYGFGMCLDGKSECKCKEYIAINQSWMNPNETKLKIEGNEALLTGAQTACTSKGGIITITHSGQNAHYIKAAADQAKAVKAKKEAVLTAQSTPSNDPVATEIATPIASTLAVKGVMGGVGSTIATQGAIGGLGVTVLANQNADTNNNAGNESMSKVLTPSMIRNSVAHIMHGKNEFDKTIPSYANIGVNSDYVAVEKASQDEVFVLPVDPKKYTASITSVFGWRSENGSSTHKGWDIGAPSAVDIKSMGAVTVVQLYIHDDGIDEIDGRGQYIMIKHEYQEKKFYSMYMHLSSINVKVGDVIPFGGSKIGEMGQSGKNSLLNFAYFHVHFQTFTDLIYYNKSAFNPFSGKMYGNKQSIFINGLFELDGNMPRQRWFLDMGYSPFTDISAVNKKLEKNKDEGLDYSQYFK